MRRFLPARPAFFAFLAALFGALAALAPLWPALGFGKVWDDWTLTQLGGSLAKAWLSPFAPDPGRLWRPLGSLTLALQSGASPAALRALNFFFCAVASTLAGLACARAFALGARRADLDPDGLDERGNGAMFAAFWGALGFGASLASQEAALWISARFDAMAWAFAWALALWALGAADRARQREEMGEPLRPALLAAALCSFLLALGGLLSKETFLLAALGLGAALLLARAPRRFSVACGAGFALALALKTVAQLPLMAAAEPAQAAGAQAWGAAARTLANLALSGLNLSPEPSPVWIDPPEAFAGGHWMIGAAPFYFRQLAALGGWALALAACLAVSAFAWRRLRRTAPFNPAVRDRLAVALCLAMALAPPAVFALAPFAWPYGSMVDGAARHGGWSLVAALPAVAFWAAGASVRQRVAGALAVVWVGLAFLAAPAQLAWRKDEAVFWQAVLGEHPSSAYAALNGSRAQVRSGRPEEGPAILDRLLRTEADPRLACVLAQVRERELSEIGRPQQALAFLDRLGGFAGCSPLMAQDRVALLVRAGRAKDAAAWAENALAAAKARGWPEQDAAEGLAVARLANGAPASEALSGLSAEAAERAAKTLARLRARPIEASEIPGEELPQPLSEARPAGKP
jgi:hypothetical protein